MISLGALQMLELLVAAAVEEPDRNAPPASPAPGACYIVGSAPTGDWSQFAGHLAAFTSAGWRFVAPAPGMTALVKSSGLIASYSGQGWETGTVRVQRVMVDGVQVLASRAAAIPDPAGGTIVDAEARSALAQILSAMRQHGMIG